MDGLLILLNIHTRELALQFNPSNIPEVAVQDHSEIQFLEVDDRHVDDLKRLTQTAAAEKVD
jgi:hypothetical protein